MAGEVAPAKGRTVATATVRAGSPGSFKVDPAFGREELLPPSLAAAPCGEQIVGSASDAHCAPTARTIPVRLAPLALQRAKNLEVTDNPLNHLQWQLDRLRSELLRLRLEFNRPRAGK